jgi:prevent-host-death family protein
MTTIGFYEARTRLSELLNQVAEGRTVLISRCGKPATVLAPLPGQAVEMCAGS